LSLSESESVGLSHPHQPNFFHNRYHAPTTADQIAEYLIVFQNHDSQNHFFFFFFVFFSSVASASSSFSSSSSPNQKKFLIFLHTHFIQFHAATAHPTIHQTTRAQRQTCLAV
jgi:hypothetical protein